MKVERAVSIDQRSELSAAPNIMKKTPSLASEVTPAAMREEPHQSIEESDLPAPEKFDTDLAFEREELLKPDSRPASHGPKVWQVKALPLKLSALEATVAVKGGVFTYDDFEVYDPAAQEKADDGPADPLSGALSATFGAVGTIAQRVGDYPLLLAKVLEAKEDDQVHKDVAEFAKDSNKGMTGILGAGLKAPMDITHNVARGFHNLPKMYGDDTVRPLEKVTDVQSGLQAAGKSFGYGLWDGMSGLVTQPMKGAEESGFMGGLMGFGKGLGGAVFKPAAGIVGLAGYVSKGIYEEVQTSRGIDEHKDVSEAQMVQGFKEWEEASEEERRYILLSIKRQYEDLETMEG
ncbi:uncharacterized protein K444DRAFT_668700 [Hyaloscypha bicolor E]|uniref:Glycosyltransferase family 1 protein n=1 Tax=Hyaloscypha bicolor E TaxID=1095630 RepID=A0A2J6SQU3_9HELO|nr:uncharacterized protein K444DRAFT_668700 [Hyaloscypha bicolor E]PMD53155.1 hypothetical protein K444DRAFT_668700 [Hyaloscypha bicolor E]